MTITVSNGTEVDELSARFVRDVMPLVDQLYRAARGLAGNHTDAEDLVQEVMLRAYRNFDQFREGTNVRGWLFRIMTNSWISRYRSALRRPEEFFGDDVDDAYVVARASHWSVASPSAELRALESLGDDEVKEAMQALPENQRMVVFYVDVEGFRYKEVAYALDLPMGTVMSRLHRGRTRLRSLLVNRAAANGYLADA